MGFEKPQLATYALTLLGMFFFSISFISTKLLLSFYGPITIVFIRLVISSCLLLLIDRIRKREIKISRKDLKFFLVLALFQPLLYFLAETFGLKQVPAGVAAIIIATIPVVTPLFSLLFLKERITSITLLVLILSFFGVTLIVVKGISTKNVSLIGAALVFSAVLAAVAYTISVRKIPIQYKPFTIVKIQNMLGAGMFLPLFLLLERKSFFIK